MRAILKPGDGVVHGDAQRPSKQRIAAWRFELLRRLGRLLMPSYRFAWPQLDWWNDQWFSNYLSIFGETDGLNSGRRFALWQLTRLTAHLQGDTAECGVYEGAGSYLICQANQTSPDRWHFVFDSFEGLSAPANIDGTYWTVGAMARSEDLVRHKLSSFRNVSFHKGWIPNRFVDVKDRSFSFVHIDVDIYRPTLDSIQFFYPRTVEGGIIVCDDYGFATCPGATAAVDEYLADKTEKMITLPYGGGLLIKGVPTAIWSAM